MREKRKNIRNTKPYLEHLMVSWLMRVLTKEKGEKNGE